jgi:hypothetical protein
MAAFCGPNERDQLEIYGCVLFVSNLNAVYSLYIVVQMK